MTLVATQNFDAKRGSRRRAAAQDARLLNLDELAGPPTSAVLAV